MIFSPRLGAVILTVMMALPGLASADEDTERLESRPHHGGEPEQISFSIYLIDVDSISERDQSFTVNMVTRVRWKDERLAHPGLGQLVGCESERYPEPSAREVCRRVLEPAVKGPIVEDLPFGHIDDNRALGVGVRTELDGDQGTLALLEPVVEQID